MSDDAERPHEDVLDGTGEVAGWSRRAFLRLMGASVALGGAAGCERPKDKIVPYVRQPEDVVPGVAASYATSMDHAGLAFGLLVESHEGRPTKVEGNPRHPASLGATDTLSQASVLSLYDPARAKAVNERGVPRSFGSFTEGFVRATRDRRGAGLFVVLEPTSSPLVLATLAMMRTELPKARVMFGSPEAQRDRARWEGARAAFGRVLEAQIDVSRAEAIASFGMDLLAARPETVHLARNVMERRRVRGRSDAMARLWVAESAMSVTGASCDHRVALRPSEMVPALAGLLGELARSGAEGIPAAFRARLSSLAPGPAGPWTAALAKELHSRGRAAVVACGDDVPADGHLLAHAVDAAVGSECVSYTRSAILEAGEDAHDLAPLAAAIDAGEVSALLVLGGNPVHTAPADLELARRVRKVPLSAYLGTYSDETARACTWHLAEAHGLESWGDLRAFDGTLSFVQPLVAPMHGGRTRVEVLAAIAGDRAPDAHRSLRAYHAAHGLASDEDWEAALALGLVDGTAMAAEDVTVDWARVVAVAERASKTVSPPPHVGMLEVSLVTDVKVADGRHANNAWLQELPEPITKLTWGNALLLSTRTGKELGVETGDVVTLEASGRTLEAPVLLSPGHADGAGTIALGYGRVDGLTVGAGIGVDAYVLRTTENARAGLSARVRATGAHEKLAVTMPLIGGTPREVARSVTLAQYRETTVPARPKPRSLYFLAPKGAQQWAMSIDLGACTGCSACVVACQAENNVPVVGKEGVLAGREMHWLRIDRYVEDEGGQPRIEMMPMLCQHCESAPCEYVCPVGATTHSSDGLNQMTYPRCVGTRFCSNNCPYKVRRFNWFDYNRDTPALRALAHNPDVTVRARGVMEKCTYCVQRIREAERKARVEHRALRTGDVVTACQQSCPTRAIHFGSLTDARSDVVALRADDRTYSVLEDLGTRPRTTYLARLRNPSSDAPPNRGGGR